MRRQLRLRVDRWATVALLSLAVGAGACKKPDDADAVAEKKRQGAAPVAVKLAKVEGKKVAPRLEVTGTLDPDERSELAAQTPATVRAIFVDLGSRVKKDDVLVELDPREASLRLEAANATTASQRARLGLDGRTKFEVDEIPDVKAAKESYDLAVSEHDRAKALFETGAIPKAQLDQAKSNRDRAEASLQMARNSAQQAWAALLASQSQAGLSSKSLDDTKIRAPFDGSIAERRIAAGELAAMGRVVLVIVRDNPLRLKFDVPEADAGAIAPGKPVELRVAAFPGRLFTGSVKNVGASVKVQTRTLPVEAEVPNDKYELKPGFFATASVALSGEPRSALYVPKAAMVPAGVGFRVFVRQGGRVVERLVVPGRSEGDLVEVAGQLAEGDEVAVDKVGELSDGVPITF